MLRNIDGVADDIDEARMRAFQQVAPHEWLLSEKTLSRGGTNAVSSTGKTFKEAVVAARAKVPSGAKILAEREKEVCRSDTWQTEAPDRSQAEAAARKRLPAGATVSQARVIRDARKGILGIGARAALFEITSEVPSVAEVNFEESAVVRLTVGKVGSSITTKGGHTFGDIARVKRIDGGYEMVANPGLVNMNSGRVNAGPLEAVAAVLLAPMATASHNASADESPVQTFYRTIQSKTCTCGKRAFKYVYSAVMTERGKIDVQFDCRECGKKIDA